MKKLDETINLDDEVKAIVAYIGLKWTPIANLEQLVRDVRMKTGTQSGILTLLRCWLCFVKMRS